MKTCWFLSLLLSILVYRYHVYYSTKITDVPTETVVTDNSRSSWFYTSFWRFCLDVIVFVERCLYWFCFCFYNIIIVRFYGLSVRNKRHVSLSKVILFSVKYKKTKQTKTSKNVQLELNSTQINGYTVRTANTNSLLPSTVLNSTRMITEYNPNYDFVVANCPEQKLCEINCDNLRLCRYLWYKHIGSCLHHLFIIIPLLGTCVIYFSL